ncbi:MAG: RluA family pseudouridine synthase, partial [Gammaproteobacteria bacterium]
RAKGDRRLEAGDKVRIPPVHVREEGEAHAPSAGAMERLADRVVHEDDDLLVIDKPSGMAVHGGSGVRIGVIETLRHMRPDARFLELVHRLDRDTSGLLMIAKRRPMLTHLHEALRDGGIRKEYLALVAGVPPKRGLVVNAPLRKNTLKGGERVVRVDSTGKAAVSRFHLRENLGDCALVQVALDTGRTHQIRVHASHAGHPLAGDGKYGEPTFNRAMQARGLKRLFLHAWRLNLPRRDGANLRLECPLGHELQSVLDDLKAR